MGTLVLLLALMLVGSAAAVLVAALSSEDAATVWGALGGWLVAGLLGVTGWWTSRRAMGSGPQALAKFMLGGMLIRLGLCGAAAGLILARGWLHRNGFVLGLLAGIAVFLGVEIGGLHFSARRWSAGCVEEQHGR